MNFACPNSLIPGSVIETDICIIGSGPAGLTVAKELADTGLEVLVLESGGLEESLEAEALNAFETVGSARVTTAWRTRNRVFGGTSHSWSGRCAEFDDIDYAQRPWVANAGWPVDRATLAPFVARAAKHLGLAPPTVRRGLPRLQRDNVAAQFDPTRLKHVCWEFSREQDRHRDFTRFGARFISDGGAAPARILLNATVIRIAAGRRLDYIEVAAPDGRRIRVQSRAAVLAAGAIENARLLLASHLGNGHDQVGRFLMDHPRCVLGTFDVRRADPVRHFFGGYSMTVSGRRHDFVDGLALAPDFQRRYGLLNCATWLDEQRAPDNPLDAARRLARRRSQGIGRDAWTVMSQPGYLHRAVRDRYLLGRPITHKYARLALLSLVEQRPDPDSRITLAAVADRYGIPLPRIDWRINRQEIETVATLGRVVQGELARIGLPPLTLQDWIARDRPDLAVFEDVAHPTGTTRMSLSPQTGVVDPDCQVHGLPGLYVAGSSIFPTAGHANPTQMIMAFAIRLADHLKEALHSRAASARRPSVEPSVSGEAR